MRGFSQTPDKLCLKTDEFSLCGGFVLTFWRGHDKLNVIKKVDFYIQIIFNFIFKEEFTMSRKFRQIAAFLTCAVITASSSGTILSASASVSASAECSADDYDASVEYFIRGDALTDYSLSNMDALEIQYYLATIRELDDTSMLSADTNADGNVNIADVVDVMTWISTVSRYMYVGDYVKLDMSPYDEYFAEYSELYNSVTETINEGFSGSSYVNFDNEIGSLAAFTVNVDMSGNYKLRIKYANGTTQNRQMYISVNGSTQAVLANFEGTGSWTDWSEAVIVVSLPEGENEIKFISTTENGGPNIDYFTECRYCGVADSRVGMPSEVIDAQTPAVTETATTAAETTVTTAETTTTTTTTTISESAQQVEALSRRVSAAYNGSGVMVSWRILATDSEDTTFKLYKNGQTPAIYEGTIDEASCYFDSSGMASDWYTIDTYVGDTMTEFAQLAISLSNANSGQSGAYFDIPLDVPDDLTMPDGTTCSYSPNDASVGDVDGDGDYEIILKWDPSNSQDNSKDGYTGNVYLDCYEMDGTKLWRIDLGINIRAGAHYTQFMVYDYDGDGYAEIVCKTADGTVDGTGTVIGDASADYRSSAGRILSGPEYLTLFEGATGKTLDTIDYNPGRGDVSAWGDSYGNRVDRFTAATAYLDGTTPSVIMCRGYYTRMTATAYDVVDKKLVERWAFDTGNNSAAAGYGGGNHNCMAADVDEDGKDELVMGSAVIDDDGSLLYTTGLGHGDALHVGDFIPDNPGLEIFMCHEEGESGYGISLRDVATGEILFRETASSDTGRCIADNLIPSNNSAEFSGSHNEIVYDSTGTQLCTWGDITKWGQNSVVYWTGTFERCVLDRTMVDQYGYGRVFTGDGVTYNNSSKSNACITCDLFGDWREEMVFATSDGTALRVFGTTYTTEYAIYTLMHNVQYREQVAGQNVAYNQPPHTDYFLETGSPLPEFPDVYAAAAE